MKVFYIRCPDTGNIWSRNHWDGAASIPDFYKSKKRAQYQIDRGKCGRLTYHRDNNGQFEEIKRTPVIEEATIIF